MIKYFIRLLILTLIFSSMQFGRQLKKEVPISSVRTDLQLEAILEKTKEYCNRLKKMAFEFYCMEHLSEVSMYYKKSAILLPLSIGRFNIILLIPSLKYRHKKSNEYLYDFQMVQKQRKRSNRAVIHEKRILKVQNGKKRNRKNAKLKTGRIKIQYPVFGPVGFFSESWQKKFNYQIERRDQIEGERFYVVLVTPRQPMAQNYYEGKIWISEKDYTIWQIEWIPQNIPEIDDKQVEFIETLKRSISSMITYGVEMNGVRFPSIQKVREWYTDWLGSKHYVYKLDFQYSDYEFFTVGVEVKHDVIKGKPGEE